MRLAPAVITSSSDTESDDKDEDLAKPFDPHTFYSNSIKEETTGIIGEVCANTFQILLIKPSQEG